MQSKRQIMKSSFINKSIRRYTSITKHPYTARDISTFLFKKHKVRVNPRWIRSILTKSMRMSYKLGKSRLVNYNEVNAAQMKVLFSIKISKIINDYDALINVDESTFSRLTKTTRSWSEIGKETKLANIWFSNSMSLITGITTFGDVFSVGINGSITSQIFIEYLNNLDSFLQRKVGVFLSNCLIIMDNASVHRSKKMKEFI